jgi:hypothetical protein
MLSATCSSLDTPDIGWWGYNLFKAGSYYATTPDEVEYMAARSRAWNASSNFETSTVSQAIYTPTSTSRSFYPSYPLAFHINHVLTVLFPGCVGGLGEFSSQWSIGRRSVL